jgi:hypothetical protein
VQAPTLALATVAVFVLGVALSFALVPVMPVLAAIYRGRVSQGAAYGIYGTFYSLALRLGRSREPPSPAGPVAGNIPAAGRSPRDRVGARLVCCREARVAVSLRYIHRARTRTGILLRTNRG